MSRDSADDDEEVEGGEATKGMGMGMGGEGVGEGVMHRVASMQLLSDMMEAHLSMVSQEGYGFSLF